MSNVVISVENLSKAYRLGQIGTGTLSRDLNVWWAKVRGKPNPMLKIEQADHGNRDGATIWALNDVSFSVEQGEVLGIIGRNGAGKSTLLKILSRVTAPTGGHARVKGRIASLLEVGTGFHPDLTGRENIYLNGAILGMSRQEVRRKFDEIVDFAEIEQFIDTPVKRYSSGMYVRLAFAVAAHLEPEILLVDEVLAVGDAAFQNKCLGKMGDVARGGRTVLFVSHNLVAVSKLCKDCVWIDRGILREIGSTNTVVELYSRTALDQNKIAGGDLSKSLIKGDGRVRLLSYHVTNQLGQLDTLPKTNEDMFIHIRIFVTEPIQHPACGISIVNERGVLMTSINTVEQGISLGNFPTGEMEIVVQMRHVVFLPGSYTVSFWVMNPQYHIYVLAEDAINFEIGQSPIYGTRHIDHRWGCVYTDVTFIPNER